MTKAEQIKKSRIRTCQRDLTYYAKLYSDRAASLGLNHTLTVAAATKVKEAKQRLQQAKDNLNRR